MEPTPNGYAPEEPIRMRKQQMNLNPADDIPEDELPYADVELPTELEEVENE